VVPVTTPVVVVIGGEGVMVMVEVGVYGCLGTQMLWTQIASQG
jgi:hypothetical protein